MEPESLVSAPEEVERLVGEAQEALGGAIDILVNNAGTQVALCTMEDMSMDLWNKVLCINLTGDNSCLAVKCK